MNVLANSAGELFTLEAAVVELALPAPERTTPPKGTTPTLQITAE